MKTLTLFIAGGMIASLCSMTSAHFDRQLVHLLHTPAYARTTMQMAADSETFNWYTDAQDALCEARSEGKPVVIYLRSDNDANCTRLEQETFADNAIRARANNALWVRIDASSPDGRSLAARYGATAAAAVGPVLIVLDRDGANPRVGVGFQSAQNLAAVLDTTASR